MAAAAAAGQESAPSAKRLAGQQMYEMYVKPTGIALECLQHHN